MRSILVRLDERTLTALSRVAAAAKLRRSEFVRQAIRGAIRREEYREMREAYHRQPDSGLGEWSAAEADF